MNNKDVEVPNPDCKHKLNIHLKLILQIRMVDWNRYNRDIDPRTC